ncbi:MAG: phosphoglycerate mutase [Gemmatimonadetes bacterium]|nr:phosphoglycerate mutase [Gemmatimonadota bacterium]
MISSEYTRDLCVRDAQSKILMLVIDGLGGLPDPETGKSELETANLPNLDELANRSSCGLLSPLGPGFTPGSGPAHLALFGYDPWKTKIGRGALSALGLGLDFGEGDVAVRLNFCTVDEIGNVTDRRAGRLSNEVAQELCRQMNKIVIPGVEISVKAEMEYRAAVVFRGEGLSDGVGDSDPQVTGVPPNKLVASDSESFRMIDIANQFLQQARDILVDEAPANMILMRGFGKYPELDSFQEVYGLKSLGIAGYPMYRGVAGAVGMDTVLVDWDLESELKLYEGLNSEYDYVYFHVKKTDSAGEDGDFNRKVELLEEVDSLIPRLQKHSPDVFVVTGDHSTPAIMRSHSWHPVPTIISSSCSSHDSIKGFSERSCRNGSLGTIPSASLMAVTLAHAKRLNKFGA